MGSRRKLGGYLFVALLLAGRPLHAEPTASDKETARSLLNEGDRKRDANDLKAALGAYQAADAIMGVPTTGIEVARIEERLGKLVEARDAALRVARFPKAASEPRAYQQARAAAERLAADLATRVPSIQVKVRGAPPDAITIELDGASIAKVGADILRKVNPGPHVVTARAPGYDDVSSTVTLAERETRECQLVLTPSGSADRSKAAASTALTAGTSSAPEAEPPEASRTLGPLFYAGSAIAVAGLAVGTVAGVAELTEASKAERFCASGPREACQSDLDGAHRLATIANISFATGILGAALATWAIFRSSPSDAHGAAARASLQLSVQPGAATIAGTF